MLRGSVSKKHPTDGKVIEGIPVMVNCKGFAGVIRKIFVFPIRVYQICISPLYPARCRFHPSCSEYTADAILKHGVIRGIWLGIKRICRCNPWCEGGFDPVPEKILPCREAMKETLRFVLSKFTGK